jgi:hypothetical protein
VSDLRQKKILFFVGSVGMMIIAASALNHGASGWDVFPCFMGVCALASYFRVWFSIVPMDGVKKTKSEQASEAGRGQTIK